MNLQALLRFGVTKIASPIAYVPSRARSDISTLEAQIAERLTNVLRTNGGGGALRAGKVVTSRGGGARKPAEQARQILDPELRRF